MTCDSCGYQFKTSEAYERHFAAEDEVVPAGMQIVFPRADGRICLDVPEMRRRGLRPDKRGVWAIRRRLAA